MAGVVVNAAAPANAQAPSETPQEITSQVQAAQTLGASLAKSDAMVAAASSRLKRLSAQSVIVLANLPATRTAQVTAETEALAQEARLAGLGTQVQGASTALGQQTNNSYIGGDGPLGDMAAALDALTAPSPTQTTDPQATADYLANSRTRLLIRLESVQSAQTTRSARAAAASTRATAAAETAVKAKTTLDTAIVDQRIALTGLRSTTAAQVGQAAGLRVALLRSANPWAWAADRQLAQALQGRDYTLLMNQSSSCGKGATNYANGQWPPGALCTLYAAPDQSLRRAAAFAFDAMSKAYQQQNGSALCVTEGYRSYSEQVAVKLRLPGLAATAGTSKHGLGLAVDLCGGVQDFANPAHLWLNRWAPLFGWHHPAWAEPSGALPEPWHWEFAG
jgi:hypothetical protein